MESILHSLGVSVEDEKNVEDKIVREKIQKSIDFANILHYPRAEESPNLSAKYLCILRNSLRDEVTSSFDQARDFALLKYRFFESICVSQIGDASASSTDVATPNDEISTLADSQLQIHTEQSIATIRKVVHVNDTPDNIRDRDYRTCERHRSVHGRRLSTNGSKTNESAARVEMDRVINSIHSEVGLQQLDCVAEQLIEENSHHPKQNLPRMRRSVAPSNIPSDSGCARPQKRRRPPSPSSSQSNLSEAPGSIVNCPICCNPILIPADMSADAVIDRHIDRCSRRSGSANISDSVEVNRGIHYHKRNSSVGRSSAVHRGSAICLDLVPSDSVDFADEEDDDNVDVAAEFPGTLSGRQQQRRKAHRVENIESSCEEEDEDDSTTLKGEYADGAQSDEDPLTEKEDISLQRIGRGAIRPANSKLVDDWEQSVFENRLRLYLSVGADKDSGGEDEEDKSDEQREEEMITTEFGVSVDKDSWQALYEYQRQGVKWMWDLYRSGSGSGGILGDEMGLGKTAQLCVHFATIAHNETQELRRSSRDGQIQQCPMFFIACPATVLQHWLKEMHRWAPRVRTVILHTISASFSALQSVSKKAIHRALTKISSGSDTRDVPVGVAVIVSYEGVRRLRDVLLSIRWSGVCLDEGQKIKNPEADITVACKAMPSSHRLILSGTPIQNSLRELWSLFDFVFPGRLGTLTAFETEFSTPIRLGGYSNASKLQAEIAVRTATTLQNIIRPYLLRRRQEDVINSIQLPSKTEQVIFCVLSSLQREIYKDVISSPEVERAIRYKAPVFKAIMTLRKLCNHPMLAYRQGKIKWFDNDDEKEEGIGLGSSDSLLAASDVTWSDSGKLLVLSKILPLWKAENHKVLIFCQMRSMLELIDLMLRQLGLSYMRLDGTTPVRKRDGIVDRFNSDESIFAMVLTTRTGGVGISLTAANRVIVVDPDWNPQTDIQARQRAWRIGQKREVTVYRLITKGTIEEKMYQRQIFKLLLTNRILDNPRQKRFFSKSDIRELFELGGSDQQPVEKLLNLPIAGEVDMEEEDDSNNPMVRSSPLADQNSDSQYTIIAAQSKPSSSSGHPSAADQGSTDSGRDRRLLRALFNGEAISAVYDHNYWEDGGGSGSSTSRTPRTNTVEDEHVRNLAKQAVDEAVEQLRNSRYTFVEGDASLTTPVARMQAVRASIGGAGRSSAAASVLSGLRNLHRPGGTLGEPTAPLMQNVNILSRLNKVFQRAGEAGGDGTLSTEEVLANFADLPDQFAPVFREMLRRTAVFCSGRWSLRDDVNISSG